MSRAIAHLKDIHLSRLNESKPLIASNGRLFVLETVFSEHHTQQRCGLQLTRVSQSGNYTSHDVINICTILEEHQDDIRF